MRFDRRSRWQGYDISGKPIHLGTSLCPFLLAANQDKHDSQCLVTLLPSLSQMPELLLLIPKLVLWSCLAMIIHELGHLVAARQCKVPASELGLGMGPKLFGFSLGSLRFSLRALPLGSFLMIDGTALKERTVQEQLLVHLGGIIFNLMAGLITYGTMFGWFNLLLAAGNLLPLYQHDGWKCGVVIMRALMQGKSQPAERVFTFSGGFISLAIAYAVIKVFI